MMLWLETKYINLLSSRLPKFKRKSANLWNFRCPLCNDSQTNKNTARGYIYLKKGTMRFHCHNCGVSASFPNLIKSIDPSLYYEFIKEKLVENKQDNPTIEIEMGSHTDARGVDLYNLTLSNKRAKSAVKYLIEKGIDASRLTYQGYGEKVLVNACQNDVFCSEEKHQQNRRTEFKVTKIRK